MDVLNRNEMEVMRILWEEGPLKPAQIEERFGWPIENATLRSVLRSLVDKKQAQRQKKGKAYYYRSKTTRRGVLRSMARRMAEVFAGGSTSELIAQLIKTENLSSDEIDELRRIAGKSAGRKKSGAKRRRK